MGGKFLGLNFNPTTDQITLKIAHIIRMSKTRGKQRRSKVDSLDDEWLENLRTGKLQLTKRRVLSFVMSQYDPLGLASPLMLGAKLLLRRLYASGLDCGWDEKLPEKEQATWHTFIADAMKLREISIPRAVVDSGSRERWLV